PAARSCVNVVGAFTPAVLNAGTLYQTSDLFAALNVSAYSFPLNVPSAFHAGAKFFEITPLAYVIGFSFPWLTNCLTVPGCAISAMSGGCPPATAVASTVGRSLPTGL